VGASAFLSPPTLGSLRSKKSLNGVSQWKHFVGHICSFQHKTNIALFVTEFSSQLSNYSQRKLDLGRGGQWHGPSGKSRVASPHWLQLDGPNSPPKLPFPSTITIPSSSTPIPRPIAQPQTACRYTQPFCHSILCGQTDGHTTDRRQTDR